VAYVFGMVLLVPFPFTNQQGVKLRPAVVVSRTDYNEARPDVILMPITSQLRLPLALGETLLANWHASLGRPRQRQGGGESSEPAYSLDPLRADPAGTARQPRDAATWALLRLRTFWGCRGR
jgi:mRNA interferase MazF